MGGSYLNKQGSENGGQHHILRLGVAGDSEEDRGLPQTGGLEGGRVWGSPGS